VNPLYLELRLYPVTDYYTPLGYTTLIPSRNPDGTGWDNAGDVLKSFTIPANISTSYRYLVVVETITGTKSAFYPIDIVDKEWDETTGNYQCIYTNGFVRPNSPTDLNPTYTHDLGQGTEKNALNISKNISSNDDLLIYPNPAHSTVRVSIAEKDFTENTPIRLYNLQGQIVYSSTLHKPSIELPIHQLPEGVYIVECGNARQKLIVQK
jgi:hypothetical protein